MFSLVVCSRRIQSASDCTPIQDLVMPMCMSWQRTRSVFKCTQIACLLKIQTSLLVQCLLEWMSFYRPTIDGDDNVFIVVGAQIVCYLRRQILPGHAEHRFDQDSLTCLEHDCARMNAFSVHRHTISRFESAIRVSANRLCLSTVIILL